MRLSGRHIVTVMAALITAVSISCGADSAPGEGPTATSQAASSEASPTVPPTQPDPTATPTVALRYPGMVIDLEQGDFWQFRWQWSKRSCAQGSGCSESVDDGVFTVTLGEPRTIDGIKMFAISVSGPHTADGGSTDLAPAWRYIGSDGTRLAASSGSSAVTIFDASDGQWTGGGFFSRFGNSEEHAAGPATIGEAHSFSEWSGVRSGPAISVARSDEESMCELIEGRRICPRDESFSLSESQFYREGVGPLGYTYRYSASFSGGGFFSSSSFEEAVALVGSSLRGDLLTPAPAPTRAIVPTSPPALPPRLGEDGQREFDLEIVYGPQSGELVLTSVDNQIPDFKTGVDLADGAVQVTFVNPDVTGGNWSYGVTFRHSEEEKFHALFVTGQGTWQHFMRDGTPESQVSLGSGQVDIGLGAGDENQLTVIFNPDGCLFYVNEELVADLDTSRAGAREPGGIRVITGVNSTDIYNGEVTAFKDLVIAVP